MNFIKILGVGHNNYCKMKTKVNAPTGKRNAVGGVTLSVRRVDLKPRERPRSSLPRQKKKTKSVLASENRARNERLRKVLLPHASLSIASRPPLPPATG